VAVRRGVKRPLAEFMRVPSLNLEQYAVIARCSGLRDAQALVEAVLGCGFDPAEYRAQHPGLRDAGFDEAGAFTHFLEFGYAESRDPPTGPLPDGLAGLVALAIPNRPYARTLFRTLFRQQVRHPEAARRLWQRPALAPISAIRALEGLPYAVLGDSHASHYAFDGHGAAGWLAGMPLVCLGASAADLTRDDTRQGFGAAILRWAAAAEPVDLPVLLQFGGIDAEFRWITHCLRHNISALSRTAFDDYADRAVADYARFLDRLRSILGTPRIHICAAFPTALLDRFWIDGFVAATAGTAERAPALRAALLKIALPDFAMRTAFRALYNNRLRAMCESKGLHFVDTFTPFLDASGVLDARFITAPATADAHLNYEAVGDRLEPLIRACVKSG